MKGRGLVARTRVEETWARAIIEGETGFKVTVHDDGSEPSMFDLSIAGPDGTEAVEVVAAADAAAIELWKLVNHGDDRWIDQRLAGGWAVELAPTARAKKVLQQLPDLLFEIENATAGATMAMPMDLLRRQVHDLGVTRLSQSRTDYPGSIYALLDQHHLNGVPGPQEVQGVSAWVTSFLASPEQADVVNKLRNSEAPRTHVFIVIPAFSKAPMSVVGALLHHDPPHDLSDPELPEGVSDIWMASTWAVGSGLRWSQAQGWNRFRTDPQGM